ncbi:MAG: hypothetical protein AAF700_08350 [Pseudomonadota bacterium]
MQTRTSAFYLAAVVAFLTATPLVAGITGGVFLPRLDFPEPIEAPTKSDTGSLDAVPPVLMPATGEGRTGGWIIEIPYTKQ